MFLSFLYFRQALALILLGIGLVGAWGQEVTPRLVKPSDDIQRTVEHCSRGHINGMVCLGDVDGKTYYVADQKMNWLDAAGHCKSRGLQLATIETRSEWIGLKDSLRSRPVLEWHVFWVGARDSRDLKIFSWDATGKSVSPSITNQYNTKFIDKEPHHYCLSLYNIPENSPTTEYGFYPLLCAKVHHVICHK